MEPNAVACFLQQPDSERARSSSRNGSTSKRPVISSSRPSSSGEPSESRSSRLVSSSGRLSTAQRIQPGYDSKTSFTRTAAARGGRDDTLRSFELLSIGTGKRKWSLIHLIKCLCQDTFVASIKDVSTIMVLQELLCICVSIVGFIHSWKAQWSFTLELSLFHHLHGFLPFWCIGDSPKKEI